MAKHVSYRAALRKAADENWGQKFSSMEEAKRYVIDDKVLPGVALLDIVRRINTAIKALADDKPEDWDAPDNKRPDFAKPFPDLQIGDSLYSFSDNELSQWVVVALEDGGFVRTVQANRSEYNGGKAWVHWGCEDEFPTIVEAVAHALTGEAPEDAYYRKMVAGFDALRDAVGAGDEGKILEAIGQL